MNLHPFLPDAGPCIFLNAFQFVLIFFLIIHPVKILEELGVKPAKTNSKRFFFVIGTSIWLGLYYSNQNTLMTYCDISSPTMLSTEKLTHVFFRIRCTTLSEFAAAYHVLLMRAQRTRSFTSSKKDNIKISISLDKKLVSVCVDGVDSEDMIEGGVWRL